MSGSLFDGVGKLCSECRIQLFSFVSAETKDAGSNSHGNCCLSGVLQQRENVNVCRSHFVASDPRREARWWDWLLKLGLESGARIVFSHLRYEAASCTMRTHPRVEAWCRLPPPWPLHPATRYTAGFTITQQNGIA